MNVLYLDDGTPFEYSRSRNKYDTWSCNIVVFLISDEVLNID